MTVLNAEDLANILTVETAANLPFVCKWEVILIMHCHLDHFLYLQHLQIDDPADL